MLLPMTLLISLLTSLLTSLLIWLPGAGGGSSASSPCPRYITAGITLRGAEGHNGQPPTTPLPLPAKSERSFDAALRPSPSRRCLRLLTFRRDDREGASERESEGGLGGRERVEREWGQRRNGLTDGRTDGWTGGRREDVERRPRVTSIGKVRGTRSRELQHRSGRG
jgi:hypothetical protein